MFARRGSRMNRRGVGLFTASQAALQADIGAISWDVSQGDVDLYSTEVTRNEALFVVTGLSPGTHAIRLEVTGENNPSSSNVTIAIEEIRAFMTR